MKRVVLALLLILAITCCAKESEQERAEILASSGSGSSSTGGRGAMPGSSPSSFGDPPAPSPTADSPAQASTPTHTVPAQGCDDQVVVGYDCWTAKFPRDISGKSDVECRFTVTCCGTIVSDWKRKYPQSAGPSGVVAHDSEKLTAKCRTDLPRLGDLDGDGVPNVSDDSPFDAGKARPF